MKRIDAFDFEEGERLNGKYIIVERLGDGWEGEVYLVREQGTGIERAAKFFYPQRNAGRRASRFYANKLHKLRRCSLVIQYASVETHYIDGQEIVFLVSELVEGEMLPEYLKRQPGGRLQPYMALHFLHALAAGMEEIHRQGEYHGDLHLDNIMVKRAGLSFELKLIDFYSWGRPSAEHRQDDVIDIVRVFYDALGGKRHYQNMPDAVKGIVCGLKKGLILSRFRTASRLREHLENLEWD